jgi:hypothetical protein
VRRAVLAGLVWWASASLLLCVGFLAVVYAVSLQAVAAAEPESVRQVQLGLVIYARVVLLKGLLPQLLLALGLFALLDRAFALGARGSLAVAAGVVVAAAAASLVVAPTLLRLELPALPPVRYRGPWNFLRTCAEMTAAVAVAALIPRLALTRLWRARPRAAAGRSAAGDSAAG